MSDNLTPDEKPKRQVADDVVAQKRQYFVPEHEGPSIEADDVDEAVNKAKRRTASKKRKEGDG